MAVVTLKPGFHIIVRVVPVAPVFSDIFGTIGATGTTLTRLRFPYSRLGRSGGCPESDNNPLVPFQNGGGKPKSEPRCVLLACCGCFTEEKRTSKAQILGSENISEESSQKSWEPIIPNLSQIFPHKLVTERICFCSHD